MPISKPTKPKQAHKIVPERQLPRHLGLRDRKEMSIEDWALFFELLEKICDLSHPKWEQRKAEVVDVAKAISAEAYGNLEEFLAWFDGEIRDRKKPGL